MKVGEITITKDHYKRSTKTFSDSNNCPAKIALSDAIPEATGLSIGTNDFHYWDHSGEYPKFKEGKLDKNFNFDHYLLLKFFGVKAKRVFTVL